MQSNDLSLNDIRDNFNKALDAAITTGEYPMTEQGFAGKVLTALISIAGSYPDVTAKQITDAKNAFDDETPAKLDALVRDSEAKYRRVSG